MSELDTRADTRGSRMRMPRSRGAAGGFLLIVLGVWGGLIPFIGPSLDFAFTPDQAWTWTAARGWLEVLPGAVTVLGGLMLLVSANRATAMLGGWLAVLAGTWFVVGRAFAGTLLLGDVGVPVAATDAKRTVLELAYFSGLGALIVFLGAAAIGRLSVRSARDIRYAQRAVAQVPQPAVTPQSAPMAASAPSTATAEESEPTTQPAPKDGRRHRSWSGLFGGRHTPAH